MSHQLSLPVPQAALLQIGPLSVSSALSSMRAWQKLDGSPRVEAVTDTLLEELRE